MKSSVPQGLKPDSLAFALLGAAHACLGVRNGQSLSQSLPQALALMLTGKTAAPSPTVRQNKPSNPGGAIQDIAYRTMRGRGRADAWLAVLVQRELTSPLLRELLVVAIALLDLAQEAPTQSGMEAPYAAFTIVDQAVAAAAATTELSAAKGLVNGVLRNLLRQYETLLPQILQNDEARWNHPVWWVAALRKAYPAQWQEILTVSNLPPPLTLRVNQRKTTTTAYLDELARVGLAASLIGTSAVRLHQPLPVARIPGFAQGWVSVQDEAAQRAAGLLDVHDGMRVLDACAAPGGKTGHLLELADLDLTALDVDQQRLQLVQQNLDRLQLQAKLVAGSANVPELERPDWWDGQLYDRILADVPCTASGIVRRHPDIRWLRRETDAASLSRIQQQILDSLWRLLRPDGKLLLVTCSLFPLESKYQADAFAARHADARMLSAPGQLLPTSSPALLSNDNIQVEHDGLFFALFQKVV